MSESRAWHYYVGDMINFAQKALEYSDGLVQTRFVSSGINYDATLRNLELIGRGCYPYSQRGAGEASGNFMASE